MAAPRSTARPSTAARPLLLGTHDFTAFTPTQTEHVRFERDVLQRRVAGPRLAEPFPGRLLEFWIEADAFMRHMVRVLVGTMLEVAGGRRSMADFEALLEGAPRERAGETAHAHGLYLASVSVLATRSSSSPGSLSSTSPPRLAGRPGRYMDEPVASITVLPSGVRHRSPG